MEVGFKQWALTRGDFASQGTFGNSWRRFWLPQGRVWELLLVSSGEDRTAAKYPAMYKSAPITKNYMAHNVEKPWFKIIEKALNVLMVFLKAKYSSHNRTVIFFSVVLNNVSLFP